MWWLGTASENATPGDVGPEVSCLAHDIIDRHNYDPDAIRQAVADGTETCELPGELRSVLGMETP